MAMSWLSRAFTWWNGPTIGTALWTRRNGREAGRDGAGNIYYQTADGKRRWVIYAQGTDSSQVPPEWHLWLHRTRDAAPTDAPLTVRPWEQPWRPNPTGTAAAELPPGSLLAGGRRPRSAGDYGSWTPDGDEDDHRLEDTRSQ